MTDVQPVRAGGIRAEAIRELIYLGMSADLLLEQCGRPDGEPEKTGTWVYRSCGEIGRLEVEVEGGKVVRLRY